MTKFNTWLLGYVDMRDTNRHFLETGISYDIGDDLAIQASYRKVKFEDSDLFGDTQDGLVFGIEYSFGAN